MDALPASDDEDDDTISHSTISPSSSSASLPMMEHTPAPPRATAIQPAPFSRPVGLGLSSVHLGEHPDWIAHDIADEIDSEDDELNDRQEMVSYMSSHRHHVDEALRSMPGVVGLGDGWAGGPQPKPKRRWFRRKQKEEPPVEADPSDPLALWQTSDAAIAPTTVETPVQSAAPPEPSPTDPKDKWWRSRRNLFASASQRVLSTPPSSFAPHVEAVRNSPPSASKTGGLRSRLNFGSMVDLRRAAEPRQEIRTADIGSPAVLTPIVTSGIAFAEPGSKASKRHSVVGLVRKPPPHPLELSHGNGSTASRSQPLVSSSASSSQPSLSPLANHPMLRTAYARSESHLAGISPGGFSPTPLIINSGSFNAPAWRPPVMSPTILLEVREEDEDEQEVPESTDRALKRSATFGDEDEYDAQKASVQPGLPSVMASPIEPQRALSVATNYSSTGDQQPPSTFLHRLRTVLTMGRGRSRASIAASSPRLPESPRSFQSEQAPSTHRPEIAQQPSHSVGRGPRPRRRLFNRRRESMVPLPTIASPITPPSVVDSPHASSAVPSPQLSNGADNNVMASGRAGVQSGVGSSSVRTRRTSWAAPIRTADEDDEDEDEAPHRVEKRRSRVSLRRFSNRKQRPPLGTVFPRPPTEVQQPPSLHWAFPASYSTPMLHKFGGSTLSLALDISADVPGRLDDIQESPTRGESDSRKPRGAEQRERALSATIAALTARQPTPTRARNPVDARARRTVPINIENLNSSNESLTLPSCNVVDFPLPPSNSSGDVSSPDPDQVEHLCTPRDPSVYPTLPTGFYRREATVDSVDSGEESASSSQGVPKRQSWSTCKTSGDTLSPLATPTSPTSANGHDSKERCSSYGSLITAMEGEVSEGEQHHTAYTAKRLSVVPSALVA